MNRNPLSGAFRLILAIALGICMVCAVLFLGFYLIIVRAPAAAASNGYDVARRIAQDVRSQLHLQPRITVDSRTFIAGDTPTLELATVTRHFVHEYTLEHEWAGSTKTLTLSGEFRAKAGYNLRDLFTIDVSSDGRTVKAVLPPARLLSLEETHETVLQDTSGLWNWLNINDRTQAKNDLLASARHAMEQPELMAAARAGLIAQIQRVTGRTLQVEQTTPAPLPSPELLH